MLLHDLADRLNTVADQLPLPDQIRPDPALSEILDDEVRHLARLLGYLAGESALRHRAAARYPAQDTATQRRITFALARAAEPTGAALAALGSAIHVIGVIANLTHQGPGQARDRAAAHQHLADRLDESRTHLARAAKGLRKAADTRTAPIPAAPAPSPPAAITSRTR
ncbi:hypothetical protein AB0L75_28295 [Streptomyces sp. NPDC052101]|uniref:hypothetical protein n=1 Tax=Streptomyces sp. NPDC052101 TaxID=3155763 RepID=UPI0034429179